MTTEKDDFEPLPDDLVEDFYLRVAQVNWSILPTQESEDDKQKREGIYHQCEARIDAKLDQLYGPGLGAPDRKLSLDEYSKWYNNLRNRALITAFYWGLPCLPVRERPMDALDQRTFSDWYHRRDKRAFEADRVFNEKLKNSLDADTESFVRGEISPEELQKRADHVGVYREDTHVDSDTRMRFVCNEGQTLRAETDKWWPRPCWDGTLEFDEEELKTLGAVSQYKGPCPRCGKNSLTPHFSWSRKQTDVDPTVVE